MISLNKKLTDFDEQDIVKKYMYGTHNQNQLAKLYNIDNSSINTVLKKAEITIIKNTSGQFKKGGNPHNIKNIDQIVINEIILQYATNSYSQNKLAKEYNISRTFLRKILLSNDVKLHNTSITGSFKKGRVASNKKLTNQQDQEIITKYKTKQYTRQQLADEYGVKLDVIKTIIKKYK